MDRAGNKTETSIERLSTILQELDGEPQLTKWEEEFVDAMNEKFTNDVTLNEWEINKLEEIYKRLK